ncbi:hypothetical protein CRE_12436 [Caenorhabditis remanei]|uniref:Uncharacterized protein n=1 Tax=Caenorhabditis remanei TaxID=31234 RepID=E3NT20_CAERE|nr:hypothetical protein CRE_12436 [Caenorhabditis remanei]
MDKNRNLQWISIIFVISQHVVICQKLTEKENLIRLRDCGKHFLREFQYVESSVLLITCSSNLGSIDNNVSSIFIIFHQLEAQPSRNEIGVEFNYFNGTTEEAGFLLWITQINENTTLRFNQSTAFPISDRHVLTSSQVVMTGTQHWSLDGLHFKDWEYYANDNKEKRDCFATVPPHIAKNLIIHGKGKTFKVLRGCVFNICNTYQFEENYSPLLLEIDPPIHLNIPCLLEAQPLDEEKNRKVVDSSDFDAYGLDGGSMKHHRVKYDGIKSEYTDYRYMKTTPFYQSSNDRGGPLVMNLDGKATVAGLKASSTDIYNGRIYFNFIPMLEDRICEHSRVCSVENLAEALKKLPSTEAPSPTKSTEDGGLSQVTPSGSENSGTPRQPSSDADDAVKPRRPTYSEEVEPEESESGEDEEDTDILLDKDFNRGTSLVNLNFLIFVCVFLVFFFEMR